MTIEILRSVLGWTSLLNYGILLIWFGWIALANDWVYDMHNRFFKIGRPQFDTTHYAGMAFFKIAIFVFNIVPYLALRIVTG